MARILIIGGYGAFGSRVAERLARDGDLEIVVAGRNGEAARNEAARIRGMAKARIASAAVDGMTVTASQLTALAPGVVINASGPFQGQDYHLARTCIEARCHYIDLADGRAFVGSIAALDRDARSAGVAVISGASTVPGLSSAVVRRYAPELERLNAIDIGISPGNSFDPGLATTQSVLGGVGQPLQLRVGGKMRTVRGWQGLHRHDFSDIGRRWMGYVDVSDLDLLPAHYPDLQSARVWAGTEVGLYHLGLWMLSGLVQTGVVSTLSLLARPLLFVKRKLRFVGSDEGGMFVTLSGLGASGASKRVDWHIIAKRGHGPFIPAIPAVLLARKLARGQGRLVGAQPCFSLFTLDEFVAEVAGLDITCGLG